jgi:hypothetical protein
MKSLLLLALSGFAFAQVVPLPPDFWHLAGILPTSTVTGCPVAGETPVTTPIEKSVKQCGARAPPPGLLDFISKLPNKTSSAGAKEVEPPILIPTYFNIVSTKASQFRYSYLLPSLGLLMISTDTWFRYDDIFYINQLAVLNDRYNTTNFQFDLAGFRRIVNDTLAVGKTEAIQDEMKRKYNQGTYSSLNLYYLSDWKPTEFNGEPLGTNTYMFGACTFPTNETDAETIAIDGCIMQQDSLPGNTVKLSANGGLTTVHEIGHWLGLLHPWGTRDSTPGECEEPNFIIDLPLQYMGIEGCENNIKSCLDQVAPFVDPIHNYMSYSDDCCLYEFTPGQIRSMFLVFDALRRGK